MKIKEKNVRIIYRSIYYFTDECSVDKTFFFFNFLLVKTFSIKIETHIKLIIIIIYQENKKYCIIYITKNESS